MIASRSFNRGKAAKAVRWASTSARNLRWAGLWQRDFAGARDFLAGLASPHNLSESETFAGNQSDVHFRFGCALAGLGDAASARHHCRIAAGFKAISRKCECARSAR